MSRYVYLDVKVLTFVVAGCVISALASIKTSLYISTVPNVITCDKILYKWHAK